MLYENADNKNNKNMVDKLVCRLNIAVIWGLDWNLWQGNQCMFVAAARMELFSCDLLHFTDVLWGFSWLIQSPECQNFAKSFVQVLRPSKSGALMCPTRKRARLGRNLPRDKGWFIDLLMCLSILEKNMETKQQLDQKVGCFGKFSFSPADLRVGLHIIYNPIILTTLLQVIPWHICCHIVNSIWPTFKHYFYLFMTFFFDKDEEEKKTRPRPLKSGVRSSVWHISSDILPGISSDILAGTCWYLLVYLPAYLLTSGIFILTGTSSCFFLVYILTCF